MTSNRAYAKSGRWVLHFLVVHMKSDSGPMEPGDDHTDADLENNSVHAASIHVPWWLLEPMLFTLELDIHPCERCCEILLALFWDVVNLQILMQ